MTIKILGRPWEPCQTFESWVAYFWFHRIFLPNATFCLFWTSSLDLSRSMLLTTVSCFIILLYSTFHKILRSWIYQNFSCHGVPFQALGNCPILRFLNHQMLPLKGKHGKWKKGNSLNSNSWRRCTLEYLRGSSPLPWDSSCEELPPTCWDPSWFRGHTHTAEDWVAGDSAQSVKESEEMWNDQIVVINSLCYVYYHNISLENYQIHHSSSCVVM